MILSFFTLTMISYWSFTIQLQFIDSYNVIHLFSIGLFAFFDLTIDN